MNSQRQGGRSGLIYLQFLRSDGVGGMDYREYSGLLERYNEIDKVSFGTGDTEEDVIDRLMEISREKKQIQTECNAIIGVYRKIRTGFRAVG